MIIILEPYYDYKVKDKKCGWHKTEKQGDMIEKVCKRCGFEYAATARSKKIMGIKCNAGIMTRKDSGFAIDFTK